jgi:NTE family protein
VVGLALGGGGALGWAHLGVLRALERGGVRPDVVSGTSMGALVGACYLTENLGALEETARSMTPIRLLRRADLAAPTGGLLTGKRISRELLSYVGWRRVEDLERPYAAVAADLVTGEEVHIRRGPLVGAVRASISMPGVFRPVRAGGRLLVDGGMKSPLPTAACRALGATRIIAVNVIGDYAGAAREAGLAEESSRAWLPTVVTTAFSLTMAELVRAKVALDPPDVLLTPPVGHLNRASFHRAEELIALGEEAAEQQMEAIRSLSGSRVGG